MSVKIYRNTTKADIDVIGVGVIPAENQVSVSGDYQPHVVLENYPGLIDVTEVDKLKSPDEQLVPKGVEVPEVAVADETPVEDKATKEPK